MSGYGISLLVAGGVFLVGFLNGAYATDRWLAFGVIVWWAMLVAVLVGLRRAWTRAGMSVTGALGLFAIWTLASTGWSSNAEAAYTEFARVVLYLGILGLFTSVVRRTTAGAWCDGLALGVVAISATGLASRFYPRSVGSTVGTAILPSLGSRLSYPIGYWNGLGILAALGMPLVLSCTLRARRGAVRGLWLSAFPSLAATIYLTSSRGAIATGVAGLLAFVVLADRRWSVLGALAIAGAGAAISVRVLADRPALANGRENVVATAQSHSAVLFMVLVAAATAAVYGLATALPRPRRAPGPAVGWIASVIAVTSLVVAVITLHPVARFERFRQPPAAAVTSQSDFLKAHLLSAAGSGRWQFWQSAVDEFRAHPIVGNGAGSYAEWWAQHGTLALTIRNAHCLYLEVLGELGVVGLALLLGFLAAGIVALVGAARTAKGRERSLAAGLGGAYVGFVVAAGIDWMWQLTVVAVTAVACLALVTHVGEPRGSGFLDRRVHTGARLIAAVLAAVFVIAEGIPLLARARIDRSQAAARDGAVAVAVEQAEAAVRIEPWAASPYLQLALTNEQAGEIGSARAAIAAAVARDPDGWQARLIAARLAAKAGDVAAARRMLDQAKARNPRSAIFLNR